MSQYFYDKQFRRYIQQFIRLFSGFSVEMGKNENGLPVYQQVPVRYGDINRMAAHITRENSENVVNSVPFISCYVTSLNMQPERRTFQQHVDKVQVTEKAIDPETGNYINEPGNRYTIERHAPVPYMMQMNCDVWTSNTEQKLQLLEQILVLFNPTLDIRTSSSPHDWSALSLVEMTNVQWSSRSVGTSIDDIIDVATLTFDIPVLVNPPAKVKQQKLIHTIINQMFSLTDNELNSFELDLPFDRSEVQYTVVTYEDRKLKYEDGQAFLLSLDGTDQDSDGNTLSWINELEKFGKVRNGISQIRLRKSSNPGSEDDDIIGRLYENDNNENSLLVEIDDSTLPTNTLNAVDAIVNPQVNYPGDGVVPTEQVGQRYIILADTSITSMWNNLDANKFDIIEYNGNEWQVVFDAESNDQTHYLKNIASGDQLEWDGSSWVNSHEAVYNAGFWRLYL